MGDLLNTLVVGNLFAFLLIFMRIGIALMIMPGIGETFVPATVRLLFALGISFVLAPVMGQSLPAMPSSSVAMLSLLFTEALVGFFIGTVMRILVGSLDTAGMMVSIQSGFNNAMIFSPIMQTQGSIVGALYSTFGVVMIMASPLHIFLLRAVVESYQVFPATGHMLDTGSMSLVIAHTVNAAFKIGIQMSLPFIIVGTLVQFGFGLLGRLMPQVQVFFLALPAQILLSLITLSMVFSAGVLYWMNSYQNIITELMSQ